MKRASRPVSLWAGIIVIVIFLVLGIGWWRVAAFFDPPSIFMTAGILAGVLLAAYGPEAFRAILHSFYKPFESPAEAGHAAQVCSTAIWASLLNGLLSTLVGVINLLSMGMTDVNALTANFAFAFITLFYGTLLAILFLALRERAKTAASRPIAQNNEP